MQGCAALASLVRTATRGRGGTRGLQGREAALVCGGPLRGQYGGRSSGMRRCHFERRLERTGGRSGGLLDHSIGGSVHRVLRARRNDPGLRGGTPESGGDWLLSTISLKGRVVFSAVEALGRGGRATIKNRLKVAAAAAGRVSASVVGSDVAEGPEGADGVSGLGPWCDVAQARAVPALGIAVGGVSPLNCAGAGEMSDQDSHRGDLPRVYSDDDRGCCFARPGLCALVKEPGR